MTTIINDRDNILQAATTRLNVVNTDFISFISSATGFSVDGTTATPPTITISFIMNGRISGTPTISVSGASSVITNVISPTLTSVTVAYTNITSEICSITASLDFLGSTYTSTASISGKNTNPSKVGNFFTTTIQGLLLKLSWPKNPEVDVVGYEVRATDDSWGVDNSYLYRGSVTNCTVSPGGLGVPKYFYIRAYDATNLFSTETTSTTYTVTAPAAPTGLLATFSSTSATASTVTLTWDTSIPPFGLKEYRVRLVLPNATVVDKIVATPNITLDASWTGNASATVYVKDILGNESSASLTYTLAKNAPNAVTLPTTPASPVGSKLLLDWNEVVRTSLPIVAYEVRASDANWGVSASQLWKGAVSECQVSPGALNTLINYYVKAVDSDNIYSATATAIPYTRTAPPAITAVTYEYSTSSTGQSTITFNWSRPANETFAIELYRITLTKPGPVVISADIYANSWTVNADWEGAATLTIKTVDIFAVESTVFTKSIYKVPTSTTNYNISSPTVVNDTLLLKWTPSTIKIGVNWSRSNTTATITDSAHGYSDGQVVNITSSSDPLVIPTGNYVITYININSYSIICLNAGSSTGTISITNGSLQTTEYEIRASNNTTVLYRGSSPSYVVQSINISVGSNTYYLYAIDSAGKYSYNFRTIAYTYTLLSNITGTANFTTIGTALFKWNKPSSGSFEPTEYLLALSGAAFTTITATRSTTDWEVPVKWSNATATLTVTARDVLGNLGSSSNITLTNTLLSTPAAPTPILRGTDLELDWADNIIDSNTQLPVGRYELKDYNNNVVWKGSQSKAVISLIGIPAIQSQRTWTLYVYDTNGYPCVTPRTYEYTALIAPSPVLLSSVVSSFGTNITDSLLTISWAYQTPVFGLKYYKISYIDGDTTITSTVLSNSINISPIPKNSGNVPWSGDKNFTISVVDELGNESTSITKVITKSPPGIITNFTAQVIDNNVLLSWNLPLRTTLPINTVRLKKGSSWATAVSIGDKTGTFTTILERAGGSYTYRIAAVDSDGVEGPETAITATVAQPPDYIFTGQQFSSFTGTKINALVDQGTLVLPVDLTSTWAQHYTNNAWNTPDAQIAAGYPVYIQPTLSSGSYEETFDFGAALSSTKVTVNLLGTTIAGAVTVSVTIDVSANGTTWLPAPYEGTSLFAVNFRYVKIKIIVLQGDAGHGTYRINSLDITLDSKQKTDSGTATLYVGAAEPQGNIAHDYIDLWVPGTLPTAFGNTGSAENIISSAVGPGGYTQSIWNCIDSDTSNDFDGGWNSTGFTSDLTKGHLYAVFIQTTTNNGTTYFGLNGDGSVGDLAGSVNTNPYFWAGDLPTNNTWYLVVGYLHEIGYGTTDTGISGVYNLAGTKILPGTEYKALSGTIQSHRCYHYYNTTGSGAIVQKMARPIVIPCTTTNAPAMINYILQCVNGYGASVTPAATFIDVVSITATPSGTTPTTALVDFSDIPNPRRFNLFNYNSSGGLVGGTVSWAVRGY